MENKFNQKQLDRIVAEVDRLARFREAEIQREQVQEILQELNLPPDLLDEAIVQLHRRQALANRQRRYRWIGLGLAVFLIAAIATTTIFIQNRQQAIARISASTSRITLNQDNGSQLTTIERQTTPEVYYRVTLQQVPLGEQLSLKCNWIEPGGQIARQNSYQTRQIDKEVWPTHCRYQFSSTAPTGTWQVQMFVGDRLLSSTSFAVK